MKVDLIEAWPRQIDYPIHRQFIHENRDRFNRVIIIFTNHHAEWDYREYIKDAMSQDNVTFIENDELSDGQDWRNVAVNKGLKHSLSEWVWFTEQDFTPKEGFWDIVSMAENNAPIIGVDVSERLHPCCLFVKRKAIEETRKDFSPVPDTLDHFGLFTKELKEKFPTIDIGGSYWYHMNGLSQNIWLLQRGENPNFGVRKFKEYCRKCLELPMHEDFVKLFQWYVK